MSIGPDVLERKVIHPGNVFIKAGEENSRAYMIQQGKIIAFIIEDGQRIEVAEHGPGTIIGEGCLALDDPIQLNYEALVDTTVVTITRQDFQKKLSRADKTVKTVFSNVIRKLFDQDSTALNRAHEKAQIDDDAIKLVNGLIANLPPDKKHRYEKAILPHLNSLIKEIKGLKGEQRHQEQAVATEEKVAQIKSQGE